MTKMTMTMTCSHCGEPRTEDQPHDSRRCWTISHAYAEVLSHARPGQVNDAPAWALHIVELSRWLRDHPAPSTPQGRQARQDRVVALDGWIRKAQFIASHGGKP